jgi:hypothetical protein
MYTFCFKYEPSYGPHNWLIQEVRANNYEMAKIKLMMKLGDNLYRIIECERV